MPVENSDLVRRVYPNPPIIEAICELRFVESDDWNITLPGRLYERLQTEYASKPSQIRAITAELGISQDQKHSVNVENQLGSVQLSSKDNRHVIRVSPDSLSIHTLAPYEGWDDFAPRIMRVMDNYVDIAEPVGVSRLSVRYLNRIVIPETSFSLSEYFTAAPTSPNVSDLSISAFLWRNELEFSDAPISVVMNMATVESEAGTSAFMVDLDVNQQWDTSGLLKPEDVSDAIDILHEREGLVFEGTITDSTRGLFE